MLREVLDWQPNRRRRYWFQNWSQARGFAVCWLIFGFGIFSSGFFLKDTHWSAYIVGGAIMAVCIWLIKKG